MIISDTSVITNLISIEHLFLLKKLYKTVIIPQGVYEELSKYHPFLLNQLSSENLVKILFCLRLFVLKIK